MGSTRRSDARIGGCVLRSARSLLWCGGGLFCRAGLAQNIRHRIVTLVAGVFENLVTGLAGNEERDGPGSSKGLRIVHRHLVLDAAVTGARESFDQTQIITVLDAISVIADADQPANEI